MAFKHHYIKVPLMPLMVTVYKRTNDVTCQEKLLSKYTHEIIQMTTASQTEPGWSRLHVCSSFMSGVQCVKPQWQLPSPSL